MEKIDLSTPNITQENIEKIAALFPDAVTESMDEEGEVVRSIDFDVLRQDLSPDIVEGPRERYQFTWPGKQAAKLEARKPCSKTMRPVREDSVDWDSTENLYIEGDNLEALKIMRETYAGQVKLIYIDPPYNTGHDFIYDDDFAQTRADYQAESGEFDEAGGRLVANPEGNGRFHSDWCSMMYPRLLLARDLLSSDGAIFISIDDNESKNLRAICDEIFGAACFVGDIAWQRTYSPRNDAKGIPSEVEHVIAFSKNPDWVPSKLPRTDEMNSGYGSQDGDPKLWASDNPAAPGAVTHQGMVYGLQHPFTGEIMYPPIGSCWRIGQPGLLEIMNEWAPYELRDLDDAEKRAKVCGISPEDVRQGIKGVVLAVPHSEAKQLAEARYNEGNWPLLYFTSGGTGGIRRKRYLDDSVGRTATNLWPYSEVGHTDEAKKGLKKLFDGSAPFDTPKPVRLMDRILQIAGDKSCLVMDFFSGSASMAEGVIAKNAEDGGHRKFILVQIPEEASGDFGTLCEIGEERIRRAGAKIVESVEDANRQLELGAEPKPVPDIGFRVLRIDSSNFRDTHLEPSELNQSSIFDYIDNLIEGRTAEDLLFQVMPKFRIPYSAKYTMREIAGKTVFDVNDGQLVACFDEGVGVETIEAIAKMKPLYAVFRDASMADDATAANFEELFKTYSPDTIRKVI